MCVRGLYNYWQLNHKPWAKILEAELFESHGILEETALSELRHVVTRRLRIASRSIFLNQTGIWEQKGSNSWRDQLIIVTRSGQIKTRASPCLQREHSWGMQRRLRLESRQWPQSTWLHNCPSLNLSWKVEPLISVSSDVGSRVQLRCDDRRLNYKRGRKWGRRFPREKKK